MGSRDEEFTGHTFGIIRIPDGASSLYECIVQAVKTLHFKYKNSTGKSESRDYQTIVKMYGVCFPVNEEDNIAAIRNLKKYVTNHEDLLSYIEKAVTGISSPEMYERRIKELFPNRIHGSQEMFSKNHVEKVCKEIVETLRYFLFLYVKETEQAEKQKLGETMKTILHGYMHVYEDHVYYPDDIMPNLIAAMFGIRIFSYNANDNRLAIYPLESVREKGKEKITIPIAAGTGMHFDLLESDMFDTGHSICSLVKPTQDFRYKLPDEDMVDIVRVPTDGSCFYQCIIESIKILRSKSMMGVINPDDYEAHKTIDESYDLLCKAKGSKVMALKSLAFDTNNLHKKIIDIIGKNKPIDEFRLSIEVYFPVQDLTFRENNAIRTDEKDAHASLAQLVQDLKASYVTPDPSLDSRLRKYLTQVYSHDPQFAESIMIALIASGLGVSIVAYTVNEPKLLYLNGSTLVGKDAEGNDFTLRRGRYYFIRQSDGEKYVSTKKVPVIHIDKTMKFVEGSDMANIPRGVYKVVTLGLDTKTSPEYNDLQIMIKEGTAYVEARPLTIHPIESIESRKLKKLTIPVLMSFTDAHFDLLQSARFDKRMDIAMNEKTLRCLYKSAAVRIPLVKCKRCNRLISFNRM
jgi:hypothetical protein